jgi:type II secretory pathway component PulF
MPIYNYLAKDYSGNLVRATLSAPDRPALLISLRGRNLKLLKIESEQLTGQRWSDRWRQWHPWHFLPPNAGQIE